MTRWSGWQVAICSTAAVMPERMVSTCRTNEASSTSGMKGMKIRAVWLVTPGGRIASNSGWAAVLTEGMTMPKFLRYPRVSGMAGGQTIA